MFRESAEEIFRILDYRLTPEGAFSPEVLPGLLRRLEAARLEDKRRASDYERALEEKLRRSSYEEEDRLREEGVLEKIEQDRRSRVHLFQRIVPLEEMMRRALREDVPVVWGKP